MVRGGAIGRLVRTVETARMACTSVAATSIQVRPAASSTVAWCVALAVLKRFVLIAKVQNLANFSGLHKMVKL